MRLIKFFSAGIIALLISCSFSKPTPLLIDDLISVNNQTQALFMGCSEDGVYKPDKEGCKPQELELKAKETRTIAKDFIAGDITQPHGYDIYLQTTLIYFRMALRAEEDYTEAEKIARQFFEIQMSTSGRALNLARFYWAATTAEHAGWQILYREDQLTVQRNQEILHCAAEASVAFDETEDAMMKIRLANYIQLLVLIGGMPR